MAVKSQSQNRQLFIVCQNGEDGKQVKYKIFLKKKKKITVAGIDYSELWSFYRLLVVFWNLEDLNTPIM